MPDSRSGAFSHQGCGGGEALPSKDRRARVQRKGLVPKGRSSRLGLINETPH